MRKMWDQVGGSTPSNMATTDTEQTITANKTFEGELYKVEAGYEFTTENTGIKIGEIHKNTGYTFGSKIKLYTVTADAFQYSDHLELGTGDYFILRYNGNVSKFSFAVKTDIIGSVHYELQNVEDEAVVVSGFVTTTKTRIDLEPSASGDYKLVFDYPVSVYSWSNDSDETYRYITVAERGTKIYHHHLFVCHNNTNDTDLWMDVLSTHPESFEGEYWSRLADYKCVGTATIYELDEFGDMINCYTLCGYNSDTTDTVSLFNYQGHVMTFSVSANIQTDIVTM